MNSYYALRAGAARKDFSKKKWESHRRNKNKIDDDSLVFCIFLPHTPPFSLFLLRYRFRTPDKQASGLGNLRNIFGEHLQPQNSVSF
jgi:hypothetical protein